jgi:hypothetical protein
MLERGCGKSEFALRFDKELLPAIILLILILIIV